MSATAKPPTLLLTFGLDVNRPLTVRKALQRGLGFSSFVTFEKVSELPRQEVADLIGVSETTLLRRQKNKKLAPDESDRLFRVASVYRDLLRLFHGHAADANEWLRSPHAVFGGETPLNMLKTEYGSQQVETLIHQLEHGVYV